MDPQLLSDMRHRISLPGLRSEQRGVVLVLVAAMLVALLGIGALAIDIGSFYRAQRQAQSAADAGALAGAGVLISGTMSANASATSYATTNDPGVAANVTEPTSTSVRVSIQTTAPTLFGSIFGLSSQNVTASATAALQSNRTPCTTTGSTCYALFAMNQPASCSNGIVFGGGVHVTGGVHSNGGINLGGGGSSWGPTSYGTGCTASEPGGNYKFSPGPNAPRAEAPTTSWPIDYSADFPACTGLSCTGPCDNGSASCTSAFTTPGWCTSATNSSAETLQNVSPVNVSSGQIYCDVGSGTPGDPTTWNGAITANLNGGLVKSTYVAGTVTFGGGTSAEACGYAQTGYQVSGCSAAVPAPSTTNYPLAYAVGASSTAVNFGGGGGTLTGDIFAPNGTIVIGGGSTTSLLEGNLINWIAGGITGDGPTVSGTSDSATTSEALTQ
ncbi:MAG: pilus assembly protein TadG-related protein [Solirubrobacteraceae bacterium]